MSCAGTGEDPSWGDRRRAGRGDRPHVAVRPAGPTLALGALLVLLLTACAAAGPAGLPGPDSDQQRIWRSDGYGMVYQLAGDRLSTYQTTQVSCIAGAPLNRLGGPDAAGTLSFGATPKRSKRSKHRDQSGGDGNSSAPAAIELTLRQTPDGGAVAHVPGTVSDVDLLPLSALPGTCARAPAEDPLSTFDVFWATVAENYNSLRRKNVDWAGMRDRYRAMITPATRETELFGILRSMIEPFGDEHTGLSDSEDQDFEGIRAGTRDIPPEQTDAAADRYLQGAGGSGFVSFAGGKISYVELPGDRAYLRIDSFEDYTEAGGYQADEAALRNALDAVFTPANVARWRMLVIDVRNNEGGADQLALNVAARMTDRPYPAYRKSARNDPRDPDRHTRSQTATVTPAAGPRYTGPVRLLTGERTVSAGETFTLAMMGRQPAPERIGANTQGVYSDTLDRTLPNGWTLTLGNEDFVGVDGRSYEGPGIPPTTPTPVFPPAELAAGQDSALAAALR